MSSLYKTYEQLFGSLFEAVQLSHVFPDSKTFVDCTFKNSPEAILQVFQKESRHNSFDLTAFVEKHFEKPASPTSNFKADTSRPIEEHIQLLWEVLGRSADQKQANSSLIPLPHPYIVPGGRFGEIYYWDSYFTMLGLQVSGKVEMIQHMVDNFSFLIKTIGYIPNGNRTYFLGRSQPPFYALMVALLAEEKGDEIFVQYLPYLEKEYAFWMNGQVSLNPSKPATLRLVQLDSETILNRYWDSNSTPRAESYREDVELTNANQREKTQLYRDIRAGCESGWDFSTRWFADAQSLSQINTTALLPIDLNALLYHLEKTIAKGHEQAGHKAESQKYLQLADKRKAALLHYCWDSDKNIFSDYDFIKNENTDIPCLAMAFPLFFNMASPSQAEQVAQYMKKNLLRLGGLMTTTIHSGQQWDAPNGWAPLQWIAIQGLRNYGFDKLAATVKERWIDLNQKVYRNTGKMMEKYNVEDMNLSAGGGEYPVQDGFGWSNGVLLKLLSD